MAEPAREGETKSGVGNFVNKVVTVTTKDGRKFRGKLVQHDDYMNLVLEEAEVISGEETTKHKLLFIKGGNVSDVSI